MDDPTSIPFEFEDCDAFLASLDDNNTKPFQQDFSDMNDFTNTSTDSWNLAGPQDSYPLSSTGGNATVPINSSNKFMMFPGDLDNQNFRMQPSNFYSGNHESSNSSPLSSPSMSVNSISDSDTTGGFINGPVLYPVTNLVDTAQFSTAPTHMGRFEADYPITPPYPSASTSSSVGEPGTSPEDFGYNESYQTFTSPNQNFAPVKDETISPKEFIKPEPISPNSAANSENISEKKNTQRPQAKKSSSGPKLNSESKSNKVMKPKKEKTSHNMIEKRYRTNINDKILALRDCVPSLRCVVSGGPRQGEDLEGLTPASKLNKATVLTKATEYIQHLQKRNNMLLKQLAESRNMSSLDMSGVPEGGNRPNGMPAYPQRESGNYASKAMMLSMAGIMGAGLMNDGNDMHGLSALPVFSFMSSTRLPINPQSILFALKVTLIAGTLIYLVLPSLFGSPSMKDQKKVQQVDESINNQEHSLRDMRRQLWIANTRTFLMPAENLSAQLAALLKNIATTLIITLTGSEGYEVIARALNKEQLSSKRLALSKAIDAQLCGGDQDNASRGRLFFTFFKSFLLPATPSRYLTQAVHVNILCHGIRFVDVVGFYIAKYFWIQARSAVSNEPEATEDDDSATPKHIRALLMSFNGDSPETYKRFYNLSYGFPVSNGCLTGEDDEGYLSVLTDKSNRSVSDVFAALYSNSLVHEVLLNVLESDEIDFRKLELCSCVAPPCSIVGRRVAIAEALLLGPKDASYAKNAMDMLKEELDQQAWISRENSSSAGSVLLRAEESDSEHSSSEISMSDDSEIESVSTERNREAVFLSSAVKINTASFAVSQDSRLGIRCSLIRCYMTRNMNSHAFSLLQKVEINKLENISLLGFVAMWKVLREMHERKYTAISASSNRHKLEDLAAVARIWLGGNAGSQEGIALGKLKDLIGEAVGMSKFFGGFMEGDLDEGYGTQ